MNSLTLLSDFLEKTAVRDKFGVVRNKAGYSILEKEA